MITAARASAPTPPTTPPTMRPTGAERLRATGAAVPVELADDEVAEVGRLLVVTVEVVRLTADVVAEVSGAEVLVALVRVLLVVVLCEVATHAVSDVLACPDGPRLVGSPWWTC